MGMFINPITGQPDFVKRTGGGGSSSVIKADIAASLQIQRLASEHIMSGDLIKSDSPSLVSLANFNSIYKDAMVLGIAANDALTGDTVNIVLFGAVTNDSFSVFSINSPLFLDVNGGITDMRPLTGHLVIIGKSLGGNQIFISPKDPVVLGV